MTQSLVQETSPLETPPPGRWNRPIQIATAAVAGTTVLFGTLSVIAFGLVKTEHETHTFTTPVREVQVSSDTGDLRITSSASATGVVVNTRVSSAFAHPDHGAAVSNGVLEVTGSCPSVVIFDRCSVDFTLVVPPGTVVTARTGTGDVRVQGVTAPVTARSSTGDVTAAGLRGPADLSTNTGDVDGVDLSGADVKADSDTGDVHLVFATAPTTVSATTDTGDVKVRVPDDGTSYHVTSHVNTGDEKISAPVNSNSPRTVVLRSSTGDVKLSVN
jgi:DUF4097 and DUF4098 domain-containing protein YvlB